MSLMAARRNVDITMYSTSWCGVCARARRYMSAQNIPFTELDVEHDASAHARAAILNPRGSVPTIAIDNEVLVGFSAGSLEDGIDRAARKRSGS
jgi:glutaredoxin